MKTSSNNNNIESKNGTSQVINILTGETKKIRCHYISSRTDKPVSRVLRLERLNHPALTAAGVTAWAERFNDGVNSFDWLRVSIQLTDKTCYTPNCANVGLPDVGNYGNLDYYKGQEGMMRVLMNNVDKFFQSIADKPAKMMTGEDWPNMAVIAAYRAAGRDEEADTLTTARDIYNARREAKNEAWSKKYAAQQYYYNSPKPKNFDELTELERAQFMMQTAQECAKDHPELDWADILEKAEKRLEKAKVWQEFLDREAEKQNSFAEGMRVKVPAASLERNRDKEAFVITRIRRKAADNGGNASLTVKSELTGVERDINGSDVSEILPALQEASEIKDVPAADLCWDEDEQGVKVWGNMEQHAENLTRMGAKRGRVVFKSNKTGLPTGADCWVLPKTKSEDVRQYVRKVHERIICDFSEAREKYGDKGHKYHEGEKVVTIYGRGTVVRGRAWYASDLIDVQLDTPTYNYIWSLVGTPQKMVAVSRNDIVSIELPEPPKEIIIEDATLQEASEIKPKATDRIESRKRTIIARAKEDKQAWHYYKGYEVRVRKAYTNDSSDPESWTYCVSWYADGQLVECENGVRLEQAANALNDLPRWAEARKAA